MLKKRAFIRELFSSSEVKCTLKRVITLEPFDLCDISVKGYKYILEYIRIFCGVTYCSMRVGDVGGCVVNAWASHK